MIDIKNVGIYYSLSSIVFHVSDGQDISDHA